MKEKVFRVKILTMEDALTKRFALKKSVCHQFVVEARKEKCKIYTCYFFDKNGNEWGSCEVSHIKDAWLTNMILILTLNMWRMVLILPHIMALIFTKASWIKNLLNMKSLNGK